ALYEAYLASGRNERNAQPLARELIDLGFAQEGKALQQYLDGQTLFTIGEGPWMGCRCSLTREPAALASAGALWFDPAEAAFMTFVKELPGISPDTRGWMSIRPVHVWQFRAFLRIRRPMFHHVERFTEMNSLQ